MICKTSNCRMSEIRDGFCQECHREHALKEQTRRIQEKLKNGEAKEHDENAEQLSMKLDGNKHPRESSSQKRRRPTAKTKRNPMWNPTADFTERTPPQPPPQPKIKLATREDRPPAMYHGEGICDVGPCKKERETDIYCQDCGELYLEFAQCDGDLRRLSKIPSQFQLASYRKRAESPTPEA